MDNIIADYGFYLGWSYGAAVVSLLAEWLWLAAARRAAMKRLRRLARLDAARELP